MRRRAATLRRRPAALIGLAVALVAAASALAYFTSHGTATASASVGTLAAPTISSATPGAGTVALTWDTVTPPASGTITYYVTRDGGTPAGNCPTSASPSGVTTCTDSGLTAGSHAYKVTAVWRSWTATSTTTNVTLASGAADHFSLSAASTTPTVGADDNLTITAKDASNNTVTAYTGDKSLTFGGPGNGPNGTHPTVTSKTASAVNVGTAETITFANGVASPATSGATGQAVIKLYKLETANITVTDGSISNGTGLSVTVSAGTATSLSLSAATTTPTAGAGDNLTITALDAGGNTATSYTGDKSLTFGGPGNGPNGTHPTVTSKTASAVNVGTAETITFANGVASPATSGATGQAVIKLYKLETANITVTDGSISNGTGLSVTVSAGTATSLSLSAATTTPTAGAGDNLTITALDAGGNTATSYTGDKSLTFGGPGTVRTGPTPRSRARPRARSTSARPKRSRSRMASRAQPHRAPPARP